MSSAVLACLGAAAAATAAAAGVSPIPDGLVRRLVEESRSQALVERVHRRRLQPPGGGPPGGDGTEDDAEAETCDSADLPCTCELLGDVGTTTASGTDPVTGVLAAGENVYGPFEAGFTATQKDILINLGCTEDNVAGAYVAGGIDTHTALLMINEACNLSLPATDSGGTYRDLLDECGGHTSEYHFHERLSCLYSSTGAHSTKVAEGLDGKGLYGKWENADAQVLPALDACGAHFGVTPDSSGAEVYHYHVQDHAPFTFGCFGPNIDESFQRLVSVEECRTMYDTCGDDSTTLTLEGSVDIQYDLYCPCWDADGNNVGTISPLPAVANTTTLYGPASTDVGLGLNGAAGTAVSVAAAAAAAAAAATATAFVRT